MWIWLFAQDKIQLGTKRLASGVEFSLLSAHYYLATAYVSVLVIGPPRPCAVSAPGWTLCPRS